MNVAPASPLTRRLVAWAALAGLIALALVVLWPFLPSLAWAAVIAYATWPLHARMQRRLGQRPSLAAAFMTALTVLALFVPLIWLGWLAQTEVAGLVGRVTQLAGDPPPLPVSLARLPLIGPWLVQQWAQIAADPTTPLEGVGEWLAANLGGALALAGGVGRAVAKMVLMVVILFFFYRDGETITRQVQQMLTHFLGERAQDYIAAVGGATRGVVFGFLMTAIVQGTLAGIGYWAAGLPSPVILALLTMLLALIPFGSPIVWGVASVVLLIEGQVWVAMGLALWGALVVSQIDNVVRPLLISGATHIPFLPVLFGVLGGLLAFGLIGLFLGPIILAVLLAVWREWTTHLAKAEETPPR